MTTPNALPPLVYTWDGDGMVPMPGRFTALANDLFVVGQRYRLAEWLDRSQISHGHQFAFITEAWTNLPEPWATLIPTDGHLRKFALCRAGFCDTKSISYNSRAEAVRTYDALRGDYDWAEVHGNVVNLHKAHSQKRCYANGVRFQKMKQAILEICAELIGVAPEVLAGNAGKAA